MSKSKYIFIESGRDGNCMYYTIGHYLMYFLRTHQEKKIPELAGNLFGLLGLSESNRKTLTDYILQSKKKKQPFNSSELSKMDRILGPACRETAANVVVNEFKASPEDSHIISAANFKMVERCIDLAAKNSKKAGMLPTQFNCNQKTQQNYDKAEVNRQDFLKSEMTAFIENNIFNPHFMEEFNKKLNEKLEKEEDPSPEKIEFFKQDLLTDCLLPYTVQFFTKDNYQHLDSYAQKLKTNGQWGSEETLLSLMRYLRQEEKVTSKGSTNFIPKVTLPHAIIHNHSFQYEAQKNERFYFHNEGNTHWELFFQFNKAHDDKEAFEKLSFESEGLQINPHRQNITSSPYDANNNYYPDSSIQFELGLLGSLTLSIFSMIGGAITFGLGFYNPVAFAVGISIFAYGVIHLLTTIGLIVSYNNRQSYSSQGNSDWYGYGSDLDNVWQASPHPERTPERNDDEEKRTAPSEDPGSPYSAGFFTPSSDDDEPDLFAADSSSSSAAPA